MFQNNLLMGASAATSGTSLVSVGKSALFDGIQNILTSQMEHQRQQ